MSKFQLWFQYLTGRYWGNVVYVSSWHVIQYLQAIGYKGIHRT